MTSFAEAVEVFLRGHEAAGCTPRTLDTYREVVDGFQRINKLQTPDQLTPEALEGYLVGLRVRMRLVSAHKHYRVLRTFTRWLIRTGRLLTDPLADVVMRCPKTLPRVPDDDDVRRLLAICSNTFEGRRNRAMIALLIGSGLRKEEVRRLRIRDVDLTARLLQVRQGKGQRDRVGFFGDAAAKALRAWLAVHPDPRPPAFLFVRHGGELLGPWAIVRILHRLSHRAKLQSPIGPHALRHYCATSLLRRTGDLELVRQVLGHSTLAMALRYAALTQTDIAAKFDAASPLDHLWAGRTCKRLTMGAV